MSRLALFGAIHFDRRSKVADELSAFVASEDAEAVFVEWPEHALSRRTALRALLAVPLLVLGGIVLDLVRAPYYLLFNRRLDSTEHMAAERLDCPVHGIDRHPWTLMATAGPVAIALNWLALLAFLVIAPLAAGITIAALLVGGVAIRTVARWNRTGGVLVETVALVALIGASTVVDPFLGGFALALTALPVATALALAVSTNTTVAIATRIPVLFIVIAMALTAESLVGWFVLTTFLAFSVFVTRTLDGRNEHMAERIATITREEGYDAAVLVTGMAHLSGMADHASDAGLTVERAYTPRWLRAPGRIEDVSPADSTASDDRITGELGSAGARAAASVVDFVALGVLVWIPAFTLGIVAQSLFDSFLAGVLAGIVLTPLAYYVPLEAHYGRTLGKHLEGLTVTAADGSPASIRACLLRNLLRPVDFVVFYLLGFVLVLATDRDQRLGDLVAGTEIRVRS
ncbi:RDD family protein [Halococcus dombrowskii]|uniref:RDD family protein n=1 Tax=Halococcus dombrowskii TaxID=179637 RepID=A0AAV3SHX4_HALDO|nr:RDD family protein [Halococcus dombrowskii]UOO93961.1 RDD family protein [Halococcus dombrowskii]